MQRPSPKSDHGPNYSLAIYVNGRMAVRSIMEADQASSWHAHCLLNLSLSSIVRLEVLRSIASQEQNHVASCLVGQWDGRGAELLASARLDFRGADDTQMKSHVAIKLDLQDSIDGIPLAEGNMTQFHPVIRTTLKTNSIYHSDSTPSRISIHATYLPAHREDRETTPEPPTSSESSLKGDAIASPIHHTPQAAPHDLPSSTQTDVVVDVSSTQAGLVDDADSPPMFGTVVTSNNAHVVNVGRDNITYTIDDPALANACEVVVSINERLKVVHDSEFGKKVYDWLAAPDSSVNFNAARDKHQAETGTWFIDGTDFAEWKNHSKTALCLYGPPGCGKTILSSCIIKDIMTLCKSRAMTGYAYFYFDSRNANDGLANFGALPRSLLAQLSYRCGGIPAALEALYHDHGDGYAQPSLESLSDALRDIIAGFDHIYIVIDSLDECADRNKLLQWIQKVMRWNSDRLHILFTSRPEPDIRKQLDSVARILPVMIGKESQLDILLYLDEQLRDIDWNEETRHLVRSTLGDRADGMFRWVALQIRSQFGVGIGIAQG